MKKTFSIHTIGCKLNQYDSECIRTALVRGGWECTPFAGKPAVYIINSCTVTGRSDARCRNAVRRARRLAPGSVVLVTGCYAETQPARLAGMPEIDLVVGNAGKGAIPALLERLAGGCPIDAATAAADGRGAGLTGEIDSFLDHARAFIKIQDGCDSSCSYCIVPRARGRSASVPPEDVLRQIALLVAAGYSEIVLTGIHIGRYGADLPQATSLAGLMQLILDRTGVARLRLSSIEQGEVTPRLLELGRSTERIASHFHIPLQSGDDEVLRRMRRPYGAERFRETIETVAARIPAAAIGTDIIVGFPGEEEAHFERTRALVEELPLAYLHVFGFSPRPGTPAAALDGAVSPEARKRRSRIMRDLGAAKRRSFNAAQVGTEQLAIIEGAQRPASAFARSLTGNYCEVLVPRGLPERSLVRIRITRESRGVLYGVRAAFADAPPGEARQP